MKIPKPTEDDRVRFRTLVPDDTGVEIKPMFGNLGAFVNGNMFMGLFGSDVGLSSPRCTSRSCWPRPARGRSALRGGRWADT